MTRPLPATSDVAHIIGTMDDTDLPMHDRCSAALALLVGLAAVTHGALSPRLTAAAARAKAMLTATIDDLY